MEQTETTTLMPTFFMVFPLIAAVAVVFFVALRTVRARRRATHVSVGTYALCALITAVLIFLTVWCAQGNVDVSAEAWMQCVVTLGLVGSLIPFRDNLYNGINSLEIPRLPQGSLSAVLRTLRDAAAILVAAELARRSLEAPWNDLVATLTSQDVFIEYAVIALAMGTTYFIGQRSATGPVLICVVCAVMGIAQDFIIRFKGTAILPMDLLALGTAAEVAGQYELTLSDNDLNGLYLAAWAIFFVAFLRPKIPTTRTRLAACVTVNIMLALVCGLALDWWAEIPEYREELGYDIFYWWSSDSYREQGFMPSFLTAVEDIAIKVPEGYTQKRASELQEHLAAQADALPERAARRAASEPQFNKLKPSIIVIMNETFSDLSLYNRLDGLYDGPKFFNNLNDTLARGKMYVSVFGGGTCNSEFECLTGHSISFVGSGKYPYQMYRFNNVDNLASQLASLGYQTTAIHPNAATNWHRDSVYKQMGFNKFIAIDDFDEDAPRLHSGITDRATYDKVLDELRNNEEPQFIFDVTMQNHGGYATDDIPADRMTDYAPEGFGDGLLHELNVYLSCIQASDEDLEYFVGELRKLQRPVILMFFGDHQPGFTNQLNDGYFGDEDPEGLAHQQRLYETSYILWANYDVAGTAQNSPVLNTSADYIGALTLDYAGAPLSDFQKTQVVTHKRIPVINAMGYLGTDGRWHEPETFPNLDATYYDMEIADYLNFGSKFE